MAKLACFGQENGDLVARLQHLRVGRISSLAAFLQPMTTKKISTSASSNKPTYYKFQIHAKLA
jgi:hypothetical protein